MKSVYLFIVLFVICFIVGIVIETKKDTGSISPAAFKAKVMEEWRKK